PPGEQPRAAADAKHPVEPLGGREATGLAGHGERALREEGAGEERRAHRLLAVAAMTDADVDRLTLGFEPHRAAEAAALSGCGHRHFVRSRTPASAARAPATTSDVSRAASLPPRLRMRPSMTTVSTFSGPVASSTRCDGSVTTAMLSLSGLIATKSARF